MTSSIPSPLKSPAPATDCPALSPARTPNISVWKVADGSDLIGPNVTVADPAEMRVPGSAPDAPRITSWYPSALKSPAPATDSPLSSPLAPLNTAVAPRGSCTVTADAPAGADIAVSAPMASTQKNRPTTAWGSILPSLSS